jgi:hypothetical protein
MILINKSKKLSDSIHLLGRRGHDRMVVGLTTNLCNQCLSSVTKFVSSNHIHGEVYSIQHYVIKFVSDLQSCLYSSLGLIITIHVWRLDPQAVPKSYNRNC